MNKISDRIEGIFAHAVAMEQSGRLKSTIYCIENEIFILNSDNTVLLRFLLRKTETPFKHPVSFRANDYDSRSFYEEDGKIIFQTENENYVRTKSCSTPGDTPADIKALFEGYDKLTTNKIALNRDILSLLDDSLSHVEVSAPAKELTIVQRNIYSGAIISVKRKKGEGFGSLATVDDISTTFGPIGLRTNDFGALFTFADNLTLSFPTGGIDYCYVRSIDPKLAMEGVIAMCVYDELGGVEVARKTAAPERPQRPTRPTRPAQAPVETPVEPKPKRRCR